MKRRWLWVVAGAGLFAAGFGHRGSARAEEIEAPTAPSVEQRLSILERKYEIDQEEAAKKKAEGSTVTSGESGFSIKSNDGKSQLKIAGYVQLDHRDYLSDNDAFTDQFLLRRVRTSIEGTINNVVDFRVLPDFANGGGTTAGPTSTLLQDAYVELKTFPAFKLRAGKFKGPVSLERLQSGTALTFVERAFPSSLAPNRETGVQLSGDFGNGVFSYQTGVFNGVTDGTSGETDSNDDKDYIGRIFVQPFKPTAGFLQGLGLGVAGSIGDQKGTTSSSQLPSFRTNGQQTFFSYRSGDTFANGKRTRVSPQAYWYNNNIGLFGEFAESEQDVTRATTTTTTASIANRAWVVAASYVLTGEKASYRGVKPKNVFDPKNKGWGALELTGRFSELRIDKEAFPRYANLLTSARRAKAWTGGFNWYLNNSVKVTSNYEYTKFEGGTGTAASPQNRRSEKAILSRIQLVY